MIFAVTAATALLIGVSGAPGSVQPDQQLITAASNVRLRADASEEVRILATLPIGTDLVRLDETRDREWVRVRIPDGTEGWILASLTNTVPDGQRLRVMDRLIGWRLARDGDGFPTRVELLELIERAAEGLQGEEAAQFALYRLQALDGVLRSIRFSYAYGRRTEPEASWLDAHDALILHNEPGGQWMLRREVILDEHARHRGTRVARRIAWLAVTNGLPGECEGYVPCYVEREDLLLGDFLRWYPDGSYVKTALVRLIDRATYWQSLLEDGNTRFFDPAADCGRLRPSLAALRAAVETAGTGSPYRGSGESQLRAPLLQVLNEVGKPCGIGSG